VHRTDDRFGRHLGAGNWSTSIVAALRGKGDLAIGNVVGQHLMNQMLNPGQLRLSSQGSGAHGSTRHDSAGNLPIGGHHPALPAIFWDRRSESHAGRGAFARLYDLSCWSKLCLCAARAECSAAMFLLLVVVRSVFCSGGRSRPRLLVVFFQNVGVMACNLCRQPKQSQSQNHKLFCSLVRVEVLTK